MPGISVAMMMSVNRNPHSSMGRRSLSQPVLGSMPMAMKAPVIGSRVSPRVFTLLDPSAFQVVPAQKFCHHTVPVNLHLAQLLSWKTRSWRYLAAPKLIPAVDQVDLFGKAFQKKDFGEGVVTPAHHGDGLVFKKGAVAGGAEADPMADELVFPRDPQPPIAGPRGNDNGARRELAIREDHRVRRFAGFQLQDFLAAD